MNIEEMEWPLSKEELEYLYFDEDMTQKEIGEKFNRDDSTVNYHYKKHDINCYGKGYRLRKSDKKFKKEVYEIVKNEYTILGKYKGSNTKIKIKHNKCGHIYKVSPNHFLSHNRRCPYCSPSTPKTTEQYKKEVYNLVGEEYTILSEYTKAHNKIKIKHDKCGAVYKVQASSFLSGVRCPKCKVSKGEQKIKRILKNRKIESNQQYRYNKCKNNKPLPFDFKIKNKSIVIEYNGRQHYEPVDYFGGKKVLKKQQKNDQIKKDFCKENNIKLITIPYWEKDNIEEILEEELKEVIKWN